MIRYRTALFDAMVLGLMLAVVLPQTNRCGAAALPHPLRPTVAGPDTWGAIDALGRVLPHYRQVGPPRKNKSVGIFYMIWYNNPTSVTMTNIAGPVKDYYLYDNDKIIARRKYRRNWYLIGPVGTIHWWGEPLVGYYRSSDPWVIRQNAEMLADAGVNTLILDNTNGPTYPNSQHALFKTLEHLRKLGDSTPKFLFFAGHNAWNADYQNIYKKGLYKNLFSRGVITGELYAPMSRLFCHADGK